MATVKLYSQFSFLSNQDWNWSATSTTSSYISISDGIHTQSFTGSFRYDNYGYVYGSTSSSSYYVNGQLVYSVTGMTSGANDAYKLQGFANTYGDTQATYAYVLSGNDSIIGSEFNDVLSAYAGNDTLNGGLGADTMLGGSGNDTYYVDNTGDRVFETTTTTSTTNAGGIDNVISSISFNLSAYTGVSFVENLTLTGSSAINGTGNALANTLVGNAAANVLNGSTGADIMLGGAGNDTYYVDNIGDKVYETTTTTSTINAGGTDTVISSVTFSLNVTGATYVENLRLNSANAINGTGNALNNTIFAGSGNNTIDGLGGIDTVSYAYATAGVIVDLRNTTTAQVTTSSGSDLIKNTENLTGSNFNDTLRGNVGVNTLIGSGGVDTLYGYEGNDLLRGGAGSDVLYGGTGQDIFRFDAALGSTNIDNIKDFSVLDDTVQLENSIFTKFGTTTVGAINSAYFKANTTGLAADSNDYIIYETDTGKLFYDADGSGAGASVQIATLGINLALTNSDFVLV